MTKKMNAQDCALTLQLVQALGMTGACIKDGWVYGNPFNDSPRSSPKKYQFAIDFEGTVKALVAFGSPECQIKLPSDYEREYFVMFHNRKGYIGIGIDLSLERAGCKAAIQFMYSINHAFDPLS